MKKILRNFEIEKIMATLTSENSFRLNNAIKLPQDARHALRVNMKTLDVLNSALGEGKKELVLSYYNDGRAVLNGNTYTIKNEYFQDYKRELLELLTVENEVELVPMSKESVDIILAADISIPEEDVILMLTEPNED